jgi:ubiquinone/menaquinone biosynthesis C-methylase UbiE
MIGAKAGQQILIMGAADGTLAAAVASVTGLNGRTLVVDPSTDGQRLVEAAAAKVGTLVEFERASLSTLPDNQRDFDIVVISPSLAPSTQDSAGMVAEAARVVRAGGRVVVVEGVPAAGWLSAMRRSQRPAVEATVISGWLTSAGLRAARVLAETEGVTYVEASKPRV